jgi:hypothetical protein
MFFEGLWMWFWMNKNSTAECSPQMLQKFRDIKLKRKWSRINRHWLNLKRHGNGENNFFGWLRLKKYGHGENKFFEIVMADHNLCSDTYETNIWISVFCEQKFNNVMSIFAEEKKLIFYIDKHPATKNCSKPGKCGLILKTTPAKDGANMILCTDPSDYSEKIHYHDEFQAKDMNIATYVRTTSLCYVPLSWNGIPVIRNGDVYWGELLSDCTAYRPWSFHLLVQLPNKSD